MNPFTLIEPIMDRNYHDEDAMFKMNKKSSRHVYLQYLYLEERRYKPKRDDASRQPSKELI
jgi:hypothetical protein